MLCLQSIHCCVIFRGVIIGLIQWITSPDVFSGALIAGVGLSLFLSLLCTSRFITRRLVSSSVCFGVLESAVRCLQSLHCSDIFRRGVLLGLLLGFGPVFSTSQANPTVCGAFPFSSRFQTRR